MNELGVHNPANGVAELGLGEAFRVFYNLNESELYEEAIRNGEAELTIDGAPAHGPFSEGQVRGPRRVHREHHLVG